MALSQLHHMPIEQSMVVDRDLMSIIDALEMIEGFNPCKS